MQFKQLEAFRTLMIAGTMTRASQLLGITQPAVSLAIAQLEREVGFPLFHRRGGRVVPTEEARHFFPYATRSLEALAQSRLVASQIRQGRRGTLTVAAYPSISIAFVPDLLARFRERWPDVDIRLVTRSSHVIREFASARQFDVTITELPVSYSDLSVEPVAFECVCMMPPGHPLAERGTLTPEDLDGVPFVSILRDHMTYPQISAAFLGCNARWNVVAEVQYFVTAAEMIARGTGVGLVDPITARGFAARAEFRPFSPAVTYEFGLITASSGEMSISATNFLAMLREELAALSAWSAARA